MPRRPRPTVFPRRNVVKKLAKLNTTQLVILFEIASYPNKLPSELKLPFSQNTVRANLMTLSERKDVKSANGRYITTHHKLEILEAYVKKRLLEETNEIENRIMIKLKEVENRIERNNALT